MWWLDAVLEALAPQRCAGCGAAVAAVLCGPCAERMDAVGSPCCVVLRGIPVAAAYPYQWPVRELVLAGKRNGGQRALRVLASSAAERLVGAVRPGSVLLPVPLSSRRGRVRGFNQAAVLAAGLGRLLGLPVDASLVSRSRETGSQVGRDPAGRERNVAGAFRARPGVDGIDVCVVDDVVTTGSTVAALAAALYGAGASHVAAVAVAAAPAVALTPRGGAAIMGAPCLP